MQIAIDGPAGSGKSTVAKIIAQKLNYIYLDTGAMYRAVAWACIKGNISLNTLDVVDSLLESLDISFRGQSIYLNDIDVTKHIRTPEVREIVSNIAQHPDIRYDLTMRQREIASENDVVMDGRDIGTCVLPYANLKIFLTASIEARAKRRYEEIKDVEQDVSLDDIKASIENRDIQDMNRKHAPLKQASDAILIDTSDMSVDEVVERILFLAREKGM